MGNQPGKLQTPQSGRPKKNVHWKSAGKSKECGKLNENKKVFPKSFPIFENIPLIGCESAHSPHCWWER